MKTLLYVFLAAAIHGQIGTTGLTTIEFDKTVHDYGSIPQGHHGNCEFTVKNTGSHPLIITQVKGSCGCTIAKWPQEPVMPGKSAAIQVNYNTRHIGPINRMVTVWGNFDGETCELRIKGMVTAVNQPDNTN